MRGKHTKLCGPKGCAVDNGTLQGMIDALREAQGCIAGVIGDDGEITTERLVAAYAKAEVAIVLGEEWRSDNAE